MIEPRNSGVARTGRPSPVRHATSCWMERPSQLVAAGVPTVHVQKVLGHRHLASTQVYTHVTKEQLSDSARAWE